MSGSKFLSKRSFHSSLKLICGERKEGEEKFVGSVGLWKRFNNFLSMEATVASDDANRWKIIPASFLIQLSVGSVYAWSVFNRYVSTESFFPHFLQRRYSF